MSLPAIDYRAASTECPQQIAIMSSGKQRDALRHRHFISTVVQINIGMQQKGSICVEVAIILGKSLPRPCLLTFFFWINGVPANLKAIFIAAD